MARHSTPEPPLFFLERGFNMRKKDLLVWGLVPALTLGCANTTMAAPQDTQSDAQTAAADTEVTEQSLAELRAQVQEHLKRVQDLQTRLDAQVDNMDARVTQVEAETAHPKISFSGDARLNWDKHQWRLMKDKEQQELRINLRPEYRVNDKWAIKSELQIDDNISGNFVTKNSTGGDGYLRVLQGYAEGKIGETNIKLGKLAVASPFDFDCEQVRHYNGDDNIFVFGVNGYEVNWGVPTTWNRPADFTLQSGNLTTMQNYLNSKDSVDATGKWDAGTKDFRLLSFNTKIPVARDVNLLGQYSRLRDRHSAFKSHVYAYGVDAEVAPNVKVTGMLAKSNTDYANKTHIFGLQYRQADPAKTGTYDIYVKKYLQRIHTGVDDLFYDNIEYPFEVWTGDDTAAGVDFWGSDWGPCRTAEFNGLRVGADFVPFRNAKLLLNYTFGDMSGSNGAGQKWSKPLRYTKLHAAMQLFF